MKDTIWNLLSSIVLFLAGMAAIVLLIIFTNPYSFLNPLPPAELPNIPILPTSTATLKQLPGVWTPTPIPGVGATAALTVTRRPSSTPLPTATGFRLPTATPTATMTPTPTATATITLTPTPTRTSSVTPTATPSQTATPTYTPTLTPTQAPAFTETPVSPTPES